jgi:hypothetical protein
VTMSLFRDPCRSYQVVGSAEWLADLIRKGRAGSRFLYEQRLHSKANDRTRGQQRGGACFEGCAARFEGSKDEGIRRQCTGGVVVGVGVVDVVGVDAGEEEANRGGVGVDEGVSVVGVGVGGERFGDRSLLLLLGYYSVQQVTLLA